jgi:hypothetical protein
MNRPRGIGESKEDPEKEEKRRVNTRTQRRSKVKNTKNSAEANIEESWI